MVGTLVAEMSSGSGTTAIGEEGAEAQGKEVSGKVEGKVEGTEEGGDAPSRKRGIPRGMEMPSGFREVIVGLSGAGGTLLLLSLLLLILNEEEGERVMPLPAKTLSGEVGGDEKEVSTVEEGMFGRRVEVGEVVLSSSVSVGKMRWLPEGGS